MIVSFSAGAPLFVASLYYFQLVFFVTVIAGTIVPLYKIGEASSIMELSSIAVRHLATNITMLFAATVPLLFLMPIGYWIIANTAFSLAEIVKSLKEKKRLQQGS